MEPNEARRDPFPTEVAGPLDHCRRQDFLQRDQILDVASNNRARHQSLNSWFRLTVVAHGMPCGGFVILAHKRVMQTRAHFVEWPELLRFVWWGPAFNGSCME